MGIAYYPVTEAATPTIDRLQAETIALDNGPILYASSGQPGMVREAYLLEEVDEIAPNEPGLCWVVDISPDRPFGPLSGGAPGGTPAPGETVVPLHWVWVTVNAMTGAYDVRAA